MLARARRLTRAAVSAQKSGTRAVSAHFSVTAFRSEEGRAAAVVSKKVARRSVDRHLVKRRMLEALAPFVAPGRSFIVYARAGSIELPYRALEAELRTLLTSLPKV